VSGDVVVVLMSRLFRNQNLSIDFIMAYCKHFTIPSRPSSPNYEANFNQILVKGIHIVQMSLSVGNQENAKDSFQVFKFSCQEALGQKKMKGQFFSFTFA
jgi:hypothetical protein